MLKIPGFSGLADFLQSSGMGKKQYMENLNFAIKIKECDFISWESDPVFLRVGFGSGFFFRWDPGPKYRVRKYKDTLLQTIKPFVLREAAKILFSVRPLRP